MFLRLISAICAFAAFTVGLSPPHRALPPVRNATLPAVHPPTHHVTADGTQLVYQLPSRAPVATLLLLHGCAHSATDFFARSIACPQCHALPEDARLARVALSRHYVPLAVSSTDRAGKCWRTHPSSTTGADYDRISSALSHAREQGAYDPRLPLLAVGISSGGYFASSLPSRFPVVGVDVIVSSAACSQDVQLPPAASPVPHAFTYMVRDRVTAERVERSVSCLKTLGAPSVKFPVPPRRLTVQFLVAAVPSWGSALCERVVAALTSGGVLDDTGRVLEDPRRSDWRLAVEHLRPLLDDNLVADRSPLSELLNRAWGGHEATSEFFEEALEFLESYAFED